METIDTLRTLGQGQKVRLTFADGDPVEVRVNQMEYDPETRFRVEFTSDQSDDFGRYQVDSQVVDGQWTDVTARRYDRGEQEWINLGSITRADPKEMFVSFRSSDMDAQQDTGREVSRRPE